MAAVTELVQRSRKAFEMPTLALLNKQYAPIVIAIFNSTFSADRKTISADQFHLEVDNCVAELGVAQELGISESPVRQLCTRWVREKWLIRNISDSGTEEYSLTSHAQQALEFVARAQGDRALVSESRLRTLLETMDRFAADARPSRSARVAFLDGEIARLVAERDYLNSGGTIEPVAAERMSEQFENVKYLVRELPADFTRVAESIKDLQREILVQLRQDHRPSGQVLSQYLDASEDLMGQTHEGRAFLGAMDLLHNEELLTNLDGAVQAVLKHPFAAHLTSAEKAAFRGIKNTILQALGLVLTEQQRASRTLTAQIRNHNPLRDQELDEAIRDAISQLAVWLPTSGRGQRVDPLQRFQRANFGRLKAPLADLSLAAGPEQLAPAQDVSDQGMDMEDLLSLGGPRHADLVAHLASLSELGQREVTVAHAFTSAQDHLKRPVEIFGYQEIAAASAGTEHPDLDRVTAVRADGTTREFLVNRTSLPTRVAPPATPATASDLKEDHV